MKTQDRIDREKERKRIKEKHRELKRKEREERQADSAVCQNFFDLFLNFIISTTLDFFFLKMLTLAFPLVFLKLFL